MSLPISIRDNIPNFPTPPVKSYNSLSMPNDLIADNRNYYTEIFFIDYRSAAYGQGSMIANFLNTNEGFGGGAAGAITGGVVGGAVGGVFGAALGAAGGARLASYLSATGGASKTASIRLPIPNKINDIITLNWEPMSGLQLVGSVLPAGLSQALGQAGKAVGALVGKSINPLLFLAFNNQNFREFSFDWVLAPKNKKESQTIKEIVKIFKNAALPTKALVMDYPLIAMVKMSPNNLNGHVIFKPMAVQAVAVNYTPNPNPSFFENTGAPTVVTLSVKLLEIKLWYRGEVQ